MKQTLAVFYGGRTVEHDISIVTGIQVMENIDRHKYDVLPVYIARDGRWYTGEKAQDISFLRQFDPQDKNVIPVYLPPLPGVGALLSVESKGLFNKKQQSFAFDVAIPAMHGLNGEDGSLQGLFELANVAYTSSGVLGSSVGMDKILMKAAFKGAGIPVLECEWFWRDEWENNPDVVIGRIEEHLEYPLFVKPANLGSSIGISKASDRDGLYEAVEIAVCYDRRVLVEKGIEDIAEYNCSVIGYAGEARTSQCEQPVSWKEFLSFDEKYMRDAKTGSSGMKSMSRIFPAPISEDLSRQIQDISQKIFTLLDCKGVVRIDYIFDNATQSIYANEINTIPGSFSFYLWDNEGMDFPRLIDSIVEGAQSVHREKNRNLYAFDSDVLQKVKMGSKGAKR